VDLDDLVIFRSVAAELSVTRAAARLGRVPSNVTTRIQQLEASLGVELFVRAGKRLSLSTAGEQLLDYAARLLALSDEARAVVAGGSDGAEGGCLRIGSMESTAASRLPDVLARFNARHGQTRLDVVTGPSRRLLEQVARGTLDLAFVAFPDADGEREELAAAGLDGRPLWTEELFLLLPARDRDARSPKDIRTRSLAAFAEGCAYRALSESALGITALGDWRVHEMGSYHAMIASVAAGACVATMPRSVATLAGIPEGMNALPIARRPTWLVWRSGFAAPAFARFQTMLDEVPHGD
jgi:DNA-binding transcriptional LysR family regulator